MSDDGDLTPLSNDPESLTEYCIRIGLDPETFSFNEIFSFDEEMLQMVPRPVYSVIFLYPVGGDDGPLEQRHSEEIKLSGSVPWFTLQTVPNACGTIAVIHSILNNQERFNIIPDSWISKFISKSKEMTPEQRAEYIEGNDEIQELHEDAAVEDDTPVTEDSSTNHFIAFVKHDGKLWELDGRKPQPICHGPAESLLEAAVAVLNRDFIPNIDDPMRISAVALCGNA
ncbi:Ubiquitin carboxyl-terminal hydrolase isozyme L3 [Tritrichomonas foetus]|uniref:Ubiquitin carboxyl-terminal hydrolase n=1 Tax=Tritrichomonas foetus TaxID=1144522 RepID=A0A1J4JGS7_9EUKA|nr:Ubiquitin carboxyl-terminal hydrolase isozyme L3 [Tritrichomonas foetus]|eukprot:OHS98360.1 Ubiquitin carboxyl-terminal hydrolase isozyme L3 [Tritrichomonas foetus]